jgi:phage-related protein
MWDSMSTNSIVRKPLDFIGSSRNDLRKFPKEVRIAMGTALNSAQLGGKHPAAKPLKGFGGGGVLEIVDDFDGETYRAVYTVRFEDVVYVLHAFQKKSRKRIETPKNEIDLIRRRYKSAEAVHKASKGAR